MSHTEQQIESITGHRFNDASLLNLALTHSSCDLPRGNNQRLEFLGDAVLDLAIADRLYADSPSSDEGALDRGRASLVNGKSLAAIAKQIGLAQHLEVGKAHRKHHPEPSKAMLEDALEALIGAIYLDAGFEAAGKTVNLLFDQRLKELKLSKSSKNPKGRLQEWSQKKYHGEVPLYKELDAEGPDHDRRYGAAVYLAKTELGRGIGSSKKAAETAAAEAALENFENESYK